MQCGTKQRKKKRIVFKVKAMTRHKLGTQITQCGSQINALRHQSTNRRNEEKYHNEKGDIEKFHARLLAQVPASSVAKISGWQRKTGAKREQSQAKKMGKIEEKVANATKRTRKRKTSTPRWGKKQWCLGRSEHTAPSYAWLTDVKISMYKALQISPICRLLRKTVVSRADNFGDFITADHTVLIEGSESRNNQRYTVVVQDLATRRKPSPPEWLQEFRENLVDDEIPSQGGSHASSSHEVSLEPTFKRREDLCKHSLYTYFPQDRNCEICKKDQHYKGSMQKTQWRNRTSCWNIWWLDSSRLQGPQWQLRISMQSSICSRGAGSSHSMDQGVSVQKQNFTGNREKLARVLGSR